MAYEGSQRLGDLFKSRREKGESGLPTLSVTLNNGLVDRATLGRKTDTNLADDEHLLVRKGDIVYNMMRMWQGASGLAEKDGVVSPAYVVLAPTAKIDPRYASYLFKSQRMIYLFWAYSYGLTSDRLRLYHRDFTRIPVTVPGTRDQILIADILAVLDKAMRTIELLLANNEAIRNSLIQTVLTGKRRLHGFSASWTKHSIADIARVIVSNADKKTVPGQVDIRLCNYKDVYYNRYITDDMTFMSATSTEREIKRFALAKDDVVITKDSESPNDIAVPSLVRNELTGVVCGYHLAIIRPNPRFADGAFLACLLSSPRTRHFFFSRANGATRFGLPVSSIESAEFQFPELAEQKAIASLFASIDDERRNITSQHAALGNQKTALMQQLLPRTTPREA